MVRALEEQKVLALESEQVYRNPVIYQQKEQKEIIYTEEQQAQGAPETFGNYDTNMSYLTINAIDGSVIDRGLGY